jgi:hypothetical protein
LTILEYYDLEYYESWLKNAKSIPLICHASDRAAQRLSDQANRQPVEVESELPQADL